MKNQTIESSPACQIELLIADNNDFHGIGKICMDNVQVRSDKRPMQIRLDSPRGILYPRFEFIKLEALDNNEFQIQLNAHGIYCGRGEYLDDYGQSNLWFSDSDDAVCDKLLITFKPAGYSLYERQWNGFSYSFAFKSLEREIHRLLVDATWEIGGSIIGNTVLSQGQCNMPVYHGSRERLFTTACLRTLDQYGHPQGNSFQLGPRGGLIQSFDLQYSQAGALLQYWPDLDSISSLLESQPGSELLHILDEYRFPLDKSTCTSEKHILFCAGSLAEHEARDVWWEARGKIYGQSCAKFGITPTQPKPEVWHRYHTRLDGDRLLVNVGGHEVDSTKVPYAIAERILPVLAEQGIKRFYHMTLHESDVSVLGRKRKLEDGDHGDLHCSSVCGTQRFFPSEFWGGMKAWKVMADKAHELGMEIGAWFAPHLSPNAPIYHEHPEYRMIDANGLPAGGGYGFNTLIAADWNTPVFDWALDDLKRWHEEGGLDYLWFDSLSNLGLVQENYREKMRTNFSRLGRLSSKIQELGIKSLSCECISPWMFGRFGMNDLRGDLLDQDCSVAGQNDFAWWVDNLDMMYGLWIALLARKRTEIELEQFLFQAVASGGYLCIEYFYDIDHKLPAWWSRINHMLNQTQELMKTRRLLPNRAGVSWHHGNTRLIWTFADVEVEVAEGGKVKVIDGQQCTILNESGTITIPAWSVYVITGA